MGNISSTIDLKNMPQIEERIGKSGGMTRSECIEAIAVLALNTSHPDIETDGDSYSTDFSYGDDDSDGYGDERR